MLDPTILTSSKARSLIESPFLFSYLCIDKIPATMKRLIRHVLSVPVGSADVERAFSILSHIRDQRRSRLTPKHIEGLLRIRINGPLYGKWIRVGEFFQWVWTAK